MTRLLPVLRKLLFTGTGSRLLWNPQGLDTIQHGSK